VSVNPLEYRARLILGIFFGIFSTLFLIHTLLATQGFFVVLENFFLFFENLNTFVGLFVFFSCSAFVGLSII